jgi:hypothetical protein
LDCVGDLGNLAVARTGSESVTEALLHSHEPAHHKHDCTLSMVSLIRLLMFPMKLLMVASMTNVRKVASENGMRVLVTLRNPISRIVSGYTYTTLKMYFKN